MSIDDLPDWEHYSLEELEEALAGLDRERYPERERVIRDLLRQRRREPQKRTAGTSRRSELPDWECYNLAELEQALEGLDRQAYPEREKALLQLLERRRRQEAGSNGSNDGA